MNKRIYPLDTTLRAIDSPNLNGDVFPQGHTIGEIKNWTPEPDPVPGIHQVVFTPEDFLPRVGVMRRVPTEPLKPYDLDPKIVLNRDVVEYVRAVVALRVAHKNNIPTRPSGFTEIELVQAVRDATSGHLLMGLYPQADRKELGSFLWAQGLSSTAVNNAIRAAWEEAFGNISVNIAMPISTYFAWKAELENWIRTEGKDSQAPKKEVVTPPTVLSWTEWAMNRLWRCAVRVAAGMATTEDAVEDVVWALKGHDGSPMAWPKELPDARDVRHAWDSILAAVHAKPDVVTMGDPAVLSKAFDNFLRKHEFPNAGQVAGEKPEETSVSTVKSRTRASILVENSSGSPIQKLWHLWANPREGISVSRDGIPRTKRGEARLTLSVASGVRDPIKFIEDVLSDGEISHGDLLNAFLDMADRRRHVRPKSVMDLIMSEAQENARKVGMGEEWIFDAISRGHLNAANREALKKDAHQPRAPQENDDWRNPRMVESYLRILATHGILDDIPNKGSMKGALAFIHRILPPATREYFQRYFKSQTNPDMNLWSWVFSHYEPGAKELPVVPTEQDALRLQGIAFDLCTGAITSEAALQLWIGQAWETRWGHPEVTHSYNADFVHNENFVRNWFWLAKTRLPGHPDAMAFDITDVLRWVSPEVLRKYVDANANMLSVTRDEGIVCSFDLQHLKLLAFAVSHGYLTRETATRMWVENNHGTAVQHEGEMNRCPNPFNKQFVKEWDLLVKSDPKVKIYESDEVFIPEAIRKQARWEVMVYPGGEPSDALVAVSAVARYRAGAAILGDGLGVADDWESRTVRGYEGQEKGLENPAFKSSIFAWWWISLATAMTDREEFLAPIVEICGPAAALDGFRIFLERTAKNYEAGRAVARTMVNLMVEHGDKIRAVIEDPSYRPNWGVRHGELPPIDRFEDPSTWLESVWDDEVGEESTRGRDILAMLTPPLPHQTSNNAAQLVVSVQQGSIPPVEAVMWWGKLQDIQGWGLVPAREERGVQFALVWLELADMAPHMASLQHYILNWVNHWDVKEARILRKCGITSGKAYPRRLPDKTEHSESFRNLVWDLCRDGRTLEQAVAAFKSKEVVDKIPRIPTSAREWVQTALDLAEATGDDRAYDYIRLTSPTEEIIKVVHEGFQRLRRNDDKIEAEVTEILGDGTPNERNSHPMTTEITAEQAESGVAQATLVQGFVEGKINIPTVLKAWEDKAMGVAFTTGARFQNAAGSMTMVRRWLELACYIEDASSRYRFVAPMRDWTGGVVPGMNAVLKDGGISGQPTEGPTMGSELALCAQMMVNGTWNMAFASGRLDSARRGQVTPTKPENRIIFTRDVAINWMRLSLIQGNGLGLELLEEWAGKSVIREALMTLLPTIAPRGYDWETSGPAGMWLAKEQKIRAEENAVMDVAWNVRNITAAEIVLMVHLGELESSHAVNKWNHGKPWTMGMNRRVENVLAHTTKKDGSRVPLPATVLRLWLRIASNTPNPKVFTADILTHTTPERLAEALDGLVQEGVGWANPEALLGPSALKDLPARVVNRARARLEKVESKPQESLAPGPRTNLTMATATLYRLPEDRSLWPRYWEQWANRSGNQSTLTRDTLGTLSHSARVALAVKTVAFAAGCKMPIRFLEGPIADEVFLMDELVRGVREATSDNPLSREAVNDLIRRTNHALGVRPSLATQAGLQLNPQRNEINEPVPSVKDIRFVERWCAISVALGQGLQISHLRVLGFDDSTILRGTQSFFNELLTDTSLWACANAAVTSKDPWEMAMFAPWIGRSDQKTNVNMAENLALGVARGDVTLEAAIRYWKNAADLEPGKIQKAEVAAYNKVYDQKFLEAWRAIVAIPRPGTTDLVPEEVALRFVLPEVYCPPATATAGVPEPKVNLDESLVSHKGVFYLKKEPTDAQRLMAVTPADPAGSSADKTVSTAVTVTIPGAESVLNRNLVSSRDSEHAAALVYAVRYGHWSMERAVEWWVTEHPDPTKELTRSGHERMDRKVFNLDFARTWFQMSDAITAYLVDFKVGDEASQKKTIQSFLHPVTKWVERDLVLTAEGEWMEGHRAVETRMKAQEEIHNAANRHHNREYLPVILASLGTRGGYGLFWDGAQKIWGNRANIGPAWYKEAAPGGTVDLNANMVRWMLGFASTLDNPKEFLRLDLFSELDLKDGIRDHVRHNWVYAMGPAATSNGFKHWVALMTEVAKECPDALRWVANHLEGQVEAGYEVPIAANIRKFLGPDPNLVAGPSLANDFLGIDINSNEDLYETGAALLLILHAREITMDVAVARWRDAALFSKGMLKLPEGARPKSLAVFPVGLEQTGLDLIKRLQAEDAALSVEPLKEAMRRWLDPRLVDDGVVAATYGMPAGKITSIGGPMASGKSPNITGKDDSAAGAAERTKATHEIHESAAMIAILHATGHLDAEAAAGAWLAVAHTGKTFMVPDGVNPRDPRVFTREVIDAWVRLGATFQEQGVVPDEWIQNFAWAMQLWVDPDILADVQAERFGPPATGGLTEDQALEAAAVLAVATHAANTSYARQQAVKIWSEPTIPRRQLGELRVKDRGYMVELGRTWLEILKEMPEGWARTHLFRKSMELTLGSDVVEEAMVPIKENQDPVKRRVYEPLNIKTRGMLAVETLKDDAREIALRTGVRRIRSLARARLSAWWAKATTPRGAAESQDAWEARVRGVEAAHGAFLGTDAGEAAMAMLLGFTWTAVSADVDGDQMRAFGDAVARELRVSAGSDILEGFLDEVVRPAVKSLGSAPEAAFSTNVRVVADTPVTEDSDGVTQAESAARTAHR